MNLNEVEQSRRQLGRERREKTLQSLIALFSQRAEPVLAAALESKVIVENANPNILHDTDVDFPDEIKDAYRSHFNGLNGFQADDHLIADALYLFQGDIGCLIGRDLQPPVTTREEKRKSGIRFKILERVIPSRIHEGVDLVAQTWLYAQNSGYAKEGNFYKSAVILRRAPVR